MWTFTLSISCLTTFSLPWFMHLTFQVPMQYCSLQHWTLILSPVTSTSGCCFCFGSILSFFMELFLQWSPVAYWAFTDLGSSSFSILSFCLSYCSWGFQGKNTEVVYHSLLQWTTFCQTSPTWPSHLGWPHMAWLSFIELDNAMVRVIRLTSFLWLWFQYVCPLMPSRITYHLARVFLTLDEGYLFRAVSAKCSHCSSPWMSSPYWPWKWSSFSWSSCAHAAAAPWMRGCSSWPQPLTLNVG